MSQFHRRLPRPVLPSTSHKIISQGAWSAPQFSRDATKESSVVGKRKIQRTVLKSRLQSLRRR
jgi:hypothetical protein